MRASASACPVSAKPSRAQSLVAPRLAFHFALLTSSLQALSLAACRRWRLRLSLVIPFQGGLVSCLCMMKPLSTAQTTSSNIQAPAVGLRLHCGMSASTHPPVVTNLSGSGFQGGLSRVFRIVITCSHCTLPTVCYSYLPGFKSVFLVLFSHYIS
ncbi:hypothetical protein K431DRAFT_32548 [Polychaeton citri CBS 116435]|uniref:Uncharacterized protein n=1 Tax=Polychaeton citri CBS 116435 TaxID=1314669 RepID=A0A9P4URY8_9PEZI|nr:hypothetical protein K431DRAFT_32548 [Polychaeton citri CBS 116435]